MKSSRIWTVVLLAVSAVAAFTSSIGELAAQGWFSLAAIAATVAFRGGWRRLLGGVVILSACAVSALVPQWDAAAVTAVATSAVAGGLVVVRGASWGELTARLGTAPNAQDSQELWRALSEGADPTDSSPSYPDESEQT